MKWLLDTNVCIDVLRGRDDVIGCFKECSPDELAVSVVTGFELIQGAGRAPEGLRDEERRKVSAFLAQLKQIPFDEDCGRIAGEMNARLLNRGTPVSVTDVFIAATAVSLGVPVVTSNLRDFQKIEGVEVMDWRSGGPTWNDSGGTPESRPAPGRGSYFAFTRTWRWYRAWWYPT